MIMATVQRLATWLCLATCLSTGMAPASGLMLCVGLDGHIDFSSTEAGCDACTLGSPGNDAETGRIGDDRCCPCVDVPIVSGDEPTVPKVTRASAEPSALPDATILTVRSVPEGLIQGLRAVPVGAVRGAVLVRLENVRLLI